MGNDKIGHCLSDAADKENGDLDAICAFLRVCAGCLAGACCLNCRLPSAQPA